VVFYFLSIREHFDSKNIYTFFFSSFIQTAPWYLLKFECMNTLIIICKSLDIFDVRTIK
jgi:hypothetical protein